MKYLLILSIIIIFVRCHDCDHKERTNIPIYPKTIYRDPDEGSIIQINDSVMVIYSRMGSSKWDSKIVNIKNLR